MNKIKKADKHKAKLFVFFFKLQNNQKRVNRTLSYNPREDPALDDVTADTADLEAVLEQSRELLAITSEVKIQTANLAIKIING